MGNIFKEKELPYFLVLILGFIGYIIISLATTIQDYPILEYSSEFDKVKNQFNIVLENITNDKKFDDVIIYIHSSSNNIQSIERPKYLKPAFSSDPIAKPEKATPMIWEIIIGDMQPKNKIGLNINLTDSVSKSINFHATSSTTFIMREEGFISFVLKNQISIGISIIIFFIILFFVYILFYCYSFPKKVKIDE